MIARHFKRALEDILANRLVHAVTVGTIALAVLMVSAAVLVFVNTSEVLDAWQGGARIMAYLKPDADPAARGLKPRIQSLDGVAEARFLPRDEALGELKAQIPHQAGLFENLAENPLPDAFEIRLKPAGEGRGPIESIAARVAALPGIETVEFGRKWADTLRAVTAVVRTAGIAMIALFLVAAVSIVANTTRLVVYSRQDELEIMRLVGAGDGFIETPFYIAALLQGLLGAAVGLGILFGVFNALAPPIEQLRLSGVLPIRFLGPGEIGVIVAAGMLVGWLGSFLSLRRSLGR